MYQEWKGETLTRKAINKDSIRNSERGIQKYFRNTYVIPNNRA